MPFNAIRENVKILRALMQWLIKGVFYVGQSKLGRKDQESVQFCTKPDPGYQWESDKLTVIHHKREPRGQPFPSM